MDFVCVYKSMIHLCPYCGWTLNPKLESGITTCTHCNRLFDDSSMNRILSASWVCRKWHLEDPQLLQEKCMLSSEEAGIVNHYIGDLFYNHDEFLRALKNVAMTG